MRQRENERRRTNAISQSAPASHLNPLFGIQSNLHYALVVCVCVSFVFSSNSCVLFHSHRIPRFHRTNFESRKLHKVVRKTINRNQNDFLISKYGLAESAEKRLILKKEKSLEC